MLTIDKSPSACVKRSSDQLYHAAKAAVYTFCGRKNGAFESLSSLDDAGYLMSDETCCGETPGIFVAGDCRTKGVRQIATAVADGATAALAAVRFLS